MGKLADHGRPDLGDYFRGACPGKGHHEICKPAREDSSDDDEAPLVTVPRPPRPRPQPRLQPQPRPTVVPLSACPHRFRGRLRPWVPDLLPRRRARHEKSMRMRFAASLNSWAVKPRHSHRFHPFPPTSNAAPPPPATEPVPVPDAPDAKQTIAETPEPAQSSGRASQWSRALRDRQNIRNIIISAEIIGPPRGESA